MDLISSYLPPHPGLLPKWFLLVSITAVGNSIQAYTTLKFTRRVYAGTDTSSKSPKPRSDASAYPDTSPATPLSSRTFGTWSFLSAIIRLYAAYHINDPIVYQLAFWTYAIAAWHFGTEWLWYGTARWGEGLAGPVIVSSVSMAWMLWCWDGYVGK